MSTAIDKFGTAKDLRDVQRVRMKLSVIHISDISSADSKKVDNKCYSPKYDIQLRNICDWYMKHQIIQADYTVCQKFMKYVFRYTNDPLSTSLGSWIQMDTNEWVNNWNFFVPNDK